MLNILIEITNKIGELKDKRLNKRLVDIRKEKKNMITILKKRNNNEYKNIDNLRYIKILKRRIGAINKNTIETSYNLVSDRTGLKHIDEVVEYIKNHGDNK